MLKISKEKLAYIISSAKEYEETAGCWDEVVRDSFNDNVVSPLGDELYDPGANSSLSEVVEDLNDAEKASLIALSMIGRGEVNAENFDRAMSLALAEDTDRAVTYLLRIPMVAEYLEEGLQRLGYSLNGRRVPELQKV
jgi:Protein of unknown function (DUF3775)